MSLRCPSPISYNERQKGMPEYAAGGQGFPYPPLLACQPHCGKPRPAYGHSAPERHCGVPPPPNGEEHTSVCRNAYDLTLLLMNLPVCIVPRRVESGLRRVISPHTSSISLENGPRQPDG
jgi:hypothetical protein